MKLTENASIGGFAFTMDKEASEAARSYISGMESCYPDKEITDGIEERMAELLLERVPKGGVVDKAAIDSVIRILGGPESIAPEDSASEPDAEKPRRRLYRDLDNAKIGGVCSGLAAYFKMDTALLRIIVAVLSLALFFAFADRSFFAAMAVPLAYLILWISIPAAKTAQQRWTLHGEDGTAEGVRRSVEQGRVSEAAHDITHSPAWHTVGRILAVTAGIILLITAVAGIFTEILLLLGMNWLGLSTVISDALVNITSEYPQAAVVSQTLWVKILAIVVYTLPFLGMFYASILLLFNLRAPSWRPGLIIFVLWLISLVALAVLAVACIFTAAAL